MSALLRRLLTEVRTLLLKVEHLRYKRRYLLSVGRHQELVAQLPGTAIAKVQDGDIVKIIGVVSITEETLVAPFSGERCTGYVAACSDGTLYKQERWCDFLLKDRTGLALVRVGPWVALNHARPSPRRQQPLSEVAAFLRACGRRENEGGEPWTTEEWKLAPGELVAVVGVGRWERDSEGDGSAIGGYRAAPRRLVLEAPPALPIVVFDQPESHEHVEV
jgi:hypothetical protein